MTRRLVARPLTREAFAPFGSVIDKRASDPRVPINAGRARRIPDLAQAVATGPGGRVAIGLVEADPRTCPLTFDLVERHPFGSQAFIPLSPAPFLVVVCEDRGGMPGVPQVFVTSPHQGVNYAANTWHGVLTPLDAPQEFLVVDRAGEGTNLEEYRYREPWTAVVVDDAGPVDAGHGPASPRSAHP